MGFIFSSGESCEPVLLVRAFVAYVIHGVCHPCSSGNEYLQSCSEKRNRTVHGKNCRLA